MKAQRILRPSVSLHVRTEQGAMSIVVFQERNQAGGNRYELLGRNVHVINASSLDIDEIAFGPASDASRGEMALFVNLGIGLRDNVLLFAISGEVIDMPSDTAFLHFAIRSFEETKVVHPRESSQRGNETNVRAFGSFHRADAPVMRRMNVADLEPGTVAGKPA